jgi:hypothetical protein
MLSSAYRLVPLPTVEYMHLHRTDAPHLCMLYARQNKHSFSLNTGCQAASAKSWKSIREKMMPLTTLKTWQN